MPEHIQYQDDDLFNPETAHEHSDVPVRPLWIAIGVFVVFAAVSHVALWFLYRGFVVSERDRSEAPQTAVPRPADASVPKNQPLLQPFPGAGTKGEPVPPYRNTPVTDLQEMRAREEAVLNHYGWVDRRHGVVHIPIEVAKERAAKMLAAQTPPVAATPDTGAVPPPASTGGSPQ
jgi:hypothetical protein